MSKVVKSNSTIVRKPQKSREIVKKPDLNVFRHNSIYSSPRDDFTVEYAVGGKELLKSIQTPRMDAFSLPIIISKITVYVNNFVL